MNGHPEIKKIVITGGPCAGKTSAMKRIREVFTPLGWAVIIVPESATELIPNGIAPWTLTSSFDYQMCQIKLQIEKEKIFEEGAKKLKDRDKVLLVCDRGLNDTKAYMTAEEFNRAFAKLGLCEKDLLNSYDAVFHLVTAARNNEEAYTLSNNSARTETLEEAVALDDRLRAAWAGHKHFRVIESSVRFEDKLQRLTDEISAFIGK